jgi:hypothetical protein
MREKAFLAILLVAILLGGFLALYATAQGPSAVVDHEGMTRSILLQEPIPDGSTYIPTSLFNDAGSDSYDDPNDPRHQESGSPAGPIAEEQDIPPVGITQINSSTVNYVLPDVLSPGTPVDLCFNVTVDTPDQEYMDRFAVDLPDTWMVTEVYTVPDSGCGTGTVAGVETGNVVYWQIDAPIPSGCGAWNNGTYDFCANISLPDCSGEPWSLPWNILGDGWGSPPHDVSGTTAPLNCLLGGVYLWPETLEVEGCHTLVQSHTLNLLNDTGTDGYFSLTYDVPSGNGSLTGPDQIYLGAGVDQDFIVELTPNACLGAGVQVTATIEAAGGSYNDRSVIVKTIRHWPTCPECPKSYYFLPIVVRSS